MRVMNQVAIFNYTNPRQFLLDALQEKQKSQSDFSVRKWAKEMGLTSHSILVMILQGKRPLRMKHAAFLSKGLNLSTQEKLFLQALIQFDTAKSIEEKELCRLWLSELNPGGQYKTCEIDQFMVISHWVHMTILSMTNLKNFDGSAEQIHKLLKGKASIHEVRSALNRLYELKLIRRNSNGKVEATYERVTSKDDVVNKGVREYHRQVIDLAKNAIEEQSVEEREFQSFSLGIPHERLVLAKTMIRKFRTQFVKAMSADTGSADDVYQFNLQFFRLTENPMFAPANKEEHNAQAGLTLNETVQQGANHVV